MTKQEVLKNVINLNNEDKPYRISVDGDKIITEIKWMDATFFSPNQVTDEVRKFRFVVQVKDDKTWLELSESEQISKRVGLGGMQMHYGGFRGKQISFSKTIGVGNDRSQGTTGIVNATFCSEDYKKPVRDYLTERGYQKTNKGFWKSLFKK